jgi:hypothetical protein
MISDDLVTVSTTVQAGTARAFALFTDEVDRWWRRGPRYRFGVQDGTLKFAGGRLVEEFPDGEVYEVGRVTAWEPGVRLVFGWRGRGFAEDERTEVEVRFESAGENATRVTVEHRGWARLAADHPMRKGMKGRAFIDMIGLWWADQLTSLRR